MVHVDVRSAMAIALFAIAGIVATDLAIGRELEPVREGRVTIDARRALEQRSRPPGVEGLLTIVEGGRYLVHTASVTRAGTAVDDPERNTRHQGATQKKKLLAHLPDGAIRATVATATTSAELTIRAASIERPGLWISLAITLAAGLLSFFGLQLKLSPRTSALIALAVTLAVVLYFAELSMTVAEQAATAYLAQSTGSPPNVVLQPLRVLVWPLSLFPLFAAFLAWKARRA
jgi:hypothetical protein